MKVMLKRDRVSYWTANCAKYGVKNLRICNLKQFCLAVDLDYQSLGARITKARKTSLCQATLDGWVINWHYVDELRSTLEAMGVPLTVRLETYFVETPRDKRDQDAFDAEFRNLCARIALVGTSTFLIENAPPTKAKASSKKGK